MKRIISIILICAVLCVVPSAVGASQEGTNIEKSDEAAIRDPNATPRENLEAVLEYYCWFFYRTPTYWYSYFSEESYDYYLSVKNEAEALLADENATDEALTAAAEKFLAARESLVPVVYYEDPADALSARGRVYMLLLDYCWDFSFSPEYYYLFYTRDSYDAHYNAKRKAEKLYGDENTTDREFRDMVVELDTAIMNRVRLSSIKPGEPESRDELRSLMQSNFQFFIWQDYYDEEIWEATPYTKESYNALLDTAHRAQDLVADENATDEEFVVMIDEFSAAIESLVLRSDVKPKLTGDADGNGSVSISDATLIQKWLAAIVSDSDIDLTVCDVNGSDSVTISDATEIQKQLAMLE